MKLTKEEKQEAGSLIREIRSVTLWNRPACEEDIYYLLAQLETLLGIKKRDKK